MPKLTCLTPTLDSTVWKAMEEAGELARAVLRFLPYEHLPAKELAPGTSGAALLTDVAEELLDVAQTCVTMIFVMEDSCGIDAAELIDVHLQKLNDKGYSYDRSRIYRVVTRTEADCRYGEGRGNYKLIHLPRLQLPEVTLLTTVCKIQEELGELTQFLGKGSGASGEVRALARCDTYRDCALELLDVAQCCFTMMYLLVERYELDMTELAAAHVKKLRRKGYCL